MASEVNYKKDFCERYFDKDKWLLDVLNQVDVLLVNNRKLPLLYIESKFQITNEQQWRKAIAQTVLTNKKQDTILSRVALIYQDEQKNDILELIDCSDDSVMYNNDINWHAEKPSNPTKDAIDRINDRVKGRITRYHNEEIKAFYVNFKKNYDTQINITENNISVVYNQWKQEVKFTKDIPDEQILINLFLVDILNGTRYKQSFYKDLEENNLFGAIKIGEEEVDTEIDLIREGTNLAHYQIMYVGNIVNGIKYDGKNQDLYYTIANAEQYEFFWRRYKRPPEKHEFLNILERSSKLYSDKYRRDTGGEYTPSCFVELQNKILNEHYNIEDFIVCDPCAGVGNLENQFGIDYKQNCYLSTLEQMDVDICKIKGFENSIQFDYLSNKEQPKWKYKGTLLDIQEICRRENKKLMVIMNPPYQKKKGHKQNLAIEFFNKIIKLQPDVIVFYYMTSSFHRDEIEQYINSGYYIVSHVFSNAKTTFQLSEWSISQIIFDKNNGEIISKDKVKTDRYELEKNVFKHKGTYIYDNTRPNLFVELQNSIKSNSTGMILGNVSYMNDVIKIGNGGTNRGNHITTDNLYYCLISKGLIFNTHHHYFELNSVVYRGEISDISPELCTDAIMFSQFYKGILFTNKGMKNYIMPFTAEELNCAKNDLNVLFPEQNKDLDMFSYNNEMEQPFDFREFFHSFHYSDEAKALYDAALKIFLYYHNSKEYSNKDYNDSFYDITNAIMGKDINQFLKLDSANDRRITKVKTTKGTRGFGRNTIKYVVSSKHLPIFESFFNARDILAKKINKQLLEQKLLLWERENIY
ncbi:MAG: hypothetical protein IJ640_11210 [Prevotella sp.]|nr:hypothetical protein [Prevotella sp.]